MSKSQLLHLSKTGARHRLRDLVRKRLNIKAFEKGGAEVVAQASSEAAKTMQELVDIINVAIEELICQRFELPGFSRLLRTARSARNHVNTHIYQTISNSLNTETKKRLNQLLTVDVELAESGWNRLKREPKKPTNKEVRTCIEHLKWLKSWVELLPDVTFIPSAKWRQFILEAQAVDIGDLKRMKPLKRYALTTILFNAQLHRAIDDVVIILTRKIAALSYNAKQKLEDYHLQRAKKIDTLIDQFRNMLQAFNHGQSDTERVEAANKALTDSPENLIAECDQHMTYAGDNYIPFMLNAYQAQRPLLLNCLELLNVQSSTSDQTLVKACKFINDHRHSKKQTLPLSQDVSLHWLSEKWQKMVIKKPSTDGVTEVDRKYF